jgi:O-antigen/teichoic acid export membrane protein
MRRIKKVANETLGILSRIKRRDFSGYTGMAVKNSALNLSTTVVAKVGSILFTIIIARMLLPELFGLYSLALSTIILFSSISDLGVGTALIKYVSQELGKKNGSPGKYQAYLLKLKIFLSVVSSLVLLLCANYLANNYYNKPIFLALIAGALYILIVNMVGFYTCIFQAHNDFKKGLFREIIFQILRLILVPLAIFILIGFSENVLLFGIIIALIISYFIGLIYLLIKRPRYPSGELDASEKKKVLWFILPLTVTGLSGMFFGYIDVVMLGRYVASEYIGLYQAALALIGSAGAVIGLSGALFPLFSRLEGQQLKLLFRKSVFYTIIIALAGVLATLVLSTIVVHIVYGSEYASSAMILKILSPIIILDSLIALYSSFIISQNKSLVVARILIFSTFLNIVLNYFLITFFLQTSEYMAVIGAGMATIIAKLVYMGLLWFSKNSLKQEIVK